MNQFQDARVIFYNPVLCEGYALTRSGEKVHIPKQALIDAKLTSLKPRERIQVKLDEYRAARVEELRLHNAEEPPSYLTAVKKQERRKNRTLPEPPYRPCGDGRA